jgi:hypothetical protein
MEMIARIMQRLKTTEGYRYKTKLDIREHLIGLFTDSLKD